MEYSKLSEEQEGGKGGYRVHVSQSPGIPKEIAEGGRERAA